jgi:hypothetical protein
VCLEIRHSRLVVRPNAIYPMRLYPRPDFLASRASEGRGVSAIVDGISWCFCWNSIACVIGIVNVR